MSLRHILGALLICCALPSCSSESQFSHVAPSTSMTAQPHTDAEIEHFVTYHGPTPSAALEQAWRGFFVNERLNRAFAVGPNSQYGVAYGWLTEKGAADTALKNCNSRVVAGNAKPICVLYAVNDEIVYPGQEYLFPFRGARIGPFTPSPEYIYYGPQKAKGLLVWSHGTYAAPGYVCGDLGSKYAAWGFITHINRAGWDIVRLDRDPCQDDLPAALRKIADGVPAAKALGYKRIVLAGQSRGSIQSLEALRDPAIARDVSAVIAISPANSGNASGAFSAGPERWKTLVNGLSGQTPVAVFFFKLDDFIPEADAEAAYARSVWPSTLPNAHVYYNDSANMVLASDGSPAGHGGAGRPAFTAKYADCLINFVDSGKTTGACAQ